MKRIIQIERILEYYDIPQVFIGIDNVSTLYICMLFEDYPTLKYFAIQVSPTRIALYIGGKIDLRELFINPEICDYFIVTSEADVFCANYYLDQKIPENMLPEAGFFNSNIQDDESLLEETIRLRHPVFRIGFIDAKNSHSIDAPVLSSALKSIQSLATNCFVKIDGKKEDKDHCLRVSTFQAASFNIHLYAESAIDIFGFSRIEHTFNELDKLFQSESEEKIKENLLRLKGHTVSSYKNLVKLLIDNKLSIKYQWLSNFNEPTIVRNKMTLPNLEMAYKVLEESTELEVEIKEFIGYFTKVDTDTGRWKIFNQADNKNYSGESNTGLLSGITVNTIVYKITCKESVEQNNININDKIIYRLDKCEQYYENQ